MKRKNKILAFVGAGLLIGFLLWTILLKCIDVKAIGPECSLVGFATINQFLYNLTGTNMSLYIVTDWLGLVPIGIAFGFGCLGLVQLIKRKSLFALDKNLLWLGAFYIVVIGVFILFELLPINYRPVLIDGCLEASYPSSTTMLVLCVLPTAVMQFNKYIKSGFIKKILICAAIFFVIFMVVGRIISGVHWFSDIVGAVLFSSGITLIYRSLVGKVQ